MAKTKKQIYDSIITIARSKANSDARIQYKKEGSWNPFTGRWFEDDRGNPEFILTLRYTGMISIRQQSLLSEDSLEEISRRAIREGIKKNLPDLVRLKLEGKMVHG